MAYIKNNAPQVGDWVITKRVHESMVGKFTRGSKVQIIGIGERGYNIEDEEGNKMYEIGWTI